MCAVQAFEAMRQLTAPAGMMMLLVGGVSGFHTPPLARPRDVMMASWRSSDGVERGHFLERLVLPGAIASLASLGVGLSAPGAASAKYTNIEEARERGDKLREEQEKVQCALLHVLYPP